MKRRQRNLYTRQTRMSLRWPERANVYNVIVAVSLTVLVLVFFWRVVIGSETFFLRDLLTTHIPAFALFDRLRYSTINPAWSQGVPWAGNPNLLVFYPTIHQAGLVSAHILIHLAIGLVGMAAFTRRALGVSYEGALLSGILFSGSGYVLSSASFLNAVTTIAWVPWLLFAAGTRAIERLWLRIVVATAFIILLVLGGEPTLAMIGIGLCAARLVVVNRKALAGFAASVTLAAAILLPLGILVWKTGRESARAVKGYSFDEAMRASLHPARLLEIVTPFIFGRPDRIMRGAWWGFAISRDAPPYIYSLSWSFLALLLILVSRQTIRESRFWIVVGLGGLLLACGGYLPGAEGGYRLLPHIWRYPIKLAFLAVTAGSILAGGAMDGLLAGKSRRARRLRPQLFFVLAAGLSGLGALYCLSRPQAAVKLMTDLWWQTAWRSDAISVVEPLVRAAGWHLFILSGCALLCALILRREGQWRGTAIAVIVFAEVASSATPLFPTVDQVAISSPSAFASAAAHLGLIYERAGKDIDAVRRGENGRYPADDSRWIAIAQARQAWATTGSMYGVRYAFNHDPDGSYPEAIDHVADLLNQRTWPERLKWLRAAGLRGVITFDRRGLGSGYTCMAEENSYGVPAYLCAIREPLPEVRRSTHVIAATDRLEAAVQFESDACDPTDCTIVDGGSSIPAYHDLSAHAVVTLDRGGRMDIETSGSAPAVLFVARPFRRTTTATLNGVRGAVLPANISYTAIPVPAGTATVSVAW